MSGRDLLYKPPVPLVLPEEEEGDEKKKVGKTDTGSTAKDLQQQERAREIGTVGEVDTQTQAGSHRKPTGQARRATYFNEDISGVRQVNLGSKPMQVLRGETGATDLKKVVLPQGHVGEMPDPEVMRTASALMGVGDLGDLRLEDALGRIGAWLQSDGVTPELLEARLKQFEQMVEARRVALARMRDPSRRKTLAHAKQVSEEETEIDDLADAGSGMMREVSEEATGLHQRLAKILGIKTESGPSKA